MPLELEQAKTIVRLKHKDAREAWVPWDEDDTAGLCQIVDGVTDKVIGESDVRAPLKPVMDGDRVVRQEMICTVPKQKGPPPK